MVGDNEGVISSCSANILELGRIVPAGSWLDMGLCGGVPDYIVDVKPGEITSVKDPQLDKATKVIKKRFESVA